jgi:Hsp20/alpha crystallin family
MSVAGSAVCASWLELRFRLDLEPVLQPWASPPGASSPSCDFAAVARGGSSSDQFLDYELPPEPREFTYGASERVLALPKGVDIEKVAAEFNNGMLEITARPESATPDGDTRNTPY